jgi:membrane dipeptidase
MDRTFALLDALKRMCQRLPDDFEIALTAADCRRIVAEGKHAAVPCIEGGHAINDSLAALRLYHELGIRYITLTHFNTNIWADASIDAPRNDGLSLFGRDVVQEMDRLGMVVDIAHTSDKTFWDTIEVTKNPIMASHSSAWELSNHPRNLKDDMLRAVATNGGVVNVNFDPKYVSESLRVAYDKNESQMWEEIDELEKLAGRAPVAHWSGTPSYVEEQRKEIRKRYSEEQEAMQLPNVSDVVDHIEHIARVAGIDHVGLGSDFDGIPPPPIGIEDVSKFPNITEELVKREYSDEDIRKVLGENTMRVMEACVGE